MPRAFVAAGLRAIAPAAKSGVIGLAAELFLAIRDESILFDAVHVDLLSGPGLLPERRTIIDPSRAGRPSPPWTAVLHECRTSDYVIRRTKPRRGALRGGRQAAGALAATRL
jgi:hypothetical protein